MIVADKIHQHVTTMPTPLQAEVLNFVEFLLHKAKHHHKQTYDMAEIDDITWSTVSLEMALRDMVDDDEPTYTLNDLKEKF